MFDDAAVNSFVGISRTDGPAVWSQTTEIVFHTIRSAKGIVARAKI
jgi:hypothetical protein